MEKIKLIALDTDGVLLEDTFSPILHNLAEKLGIAYTEEAERSTFSQAREKTLDFLKKKMNVDSEEETEKLYKLYFAERTKYLEEHGNPNPILPGVLDFIKELKEYGVKFLCYGGLPLELVDTRFKEILSDFDQYVCVNDFRPGMKEIVKEYHLDFSEVLFIDDVNNVAEECKKYNIPFIGMPANYSWGFQKEAMEKTGVKYIVSSVKELSSSYLDEVCADDYIWKRS